jgi:hypothetical protein
MKRQVQGDRLIQDMERRGILVRAASRSGVAEEAGLAYKDLAAVVDTLHRLDFSRPVVSLTRSATSRAVRGGRAPTRERPPQAPASWSHATQRSSSPDSWHLPCNCLL